MTLEILHEFCGVPNQRFVCYGAGKRSSDRYVASISHQLNPPADPEQVARLVRELNGIGPDFVEFYRQHDGLVLFQDMQSDTAGIRIATMDEWGELKEQLQEWLDFVSEDELEEAGVDWLENGIVFGEVPHSGNYFVFALDGHNTGKVIYFSHDGLDAGVYAASFSDFLERVLKDPAKELYTLGCYARYSDGTTNIQWIPERLLAGGEEI